MHLSVEFAVGSSFSVFLYNTELVTMKCPDIYLIHKTHGLNFNFEINDDSKLSVVTRGLNPIYF